MIVQKKNKKKILLYICVDNIKHTDILAVTEIYYNNIIIYIICAYGWYNSYYLYIIVLIINLNKYDLKKYIPITIYIYLIFQHLNNMRIVYISHMMLIVSRRLLYKDKEIKR